MLWAVENKTWLTEVEVAACIMAVAMTAFTLMVAHALWKSLAGDNDKNTFAVRLAANQNKK
jgi:choline-glycine betaine transporter